jgi:hypothetical protein
VQLEILNPQEIFAMTRRLFLIFLFPVIIALAFVSPTQARSGKTLDHLTFTVTVRDAADNSPLQLARVTLRRSGGASSVQAATNGMGKATFRELEAGRYFITVFYSSYNTFSDSISIDEKHQSFAVTLSEKDFNAAEVVVSASSDASTSSIDLKTANQVFESEFSHAPPTARITNVIQENVTGAANAPTGEVHIRGQHGEFTYYIDGLPVPLGVFGGLNEVVDEKVIDRATFWTGGFPAEYGGQSAAIVDIQNRVPSGKFHLDFSTYVGSYLVFNGTKSFSSGTDVPYGKSSSAAGDTLGGRVGPFRAINSNGQALSFSDHVGKFGYFVSGSRQSTDRRIDNPTATLYNDYGTDYFLYGKFDYLIGDKDYLTANLNYGRTKTQVPFDTANYGGALAPDEQTTTNAFQTLSYFRTISTERDKESNFFIGLYAREGSLIYTPSAITPATFQFANDTTLYALTEDRSFTTLGLRTKYDVRLSHQVLLTGGLTLSSTTGTEKFTSRDAAGNAGKSLVTNFSGSDFGVFVQSEWHPLAWLRWDVGVRYDQHIAPDLPLTKQVSPRIRLNAFIDDANTVYAYYGRLFMPVNIEGLRTLASASSASDNTAAPTLPQRDSFYELGFLHNFTFGLRAKVAAFYKDSSPSVDDETVGASAVKAAVNIERVRTSGLEVSLSYSNAATPFSGYLNTALIHAYGSGAITGGFLSADFTGAGKAIDLDHDQRLSVVAGLNYQPKNWFVNLTAIYGSGLTNGNPNNIDFKTGLFAFNSNAHVSPSLVLNLAAGRTFQVSGNATLEPSVYITNLFDHDYLLKGAYFSGAAYGERRNVVFKIAVHI